METILFENIVPFWDKAVDRTNGGFYGKIDNHGQVDPLAPKGLVQHARFLWSYSALYRQFGKPHFKDLAEQSLHFLFRAFYNPKTRGWNYLVSHRGETLDTRNHLYALSFVVYGLSEYFLASGNKDAFALAVQTYKLIEKQGRDHQHGGYHECFTSTFGKSEQIPEYGTVGFNKTMNTHIHLLEAYTNLYRAKKDVIVQASLQHLIDLILNKILDKEKKSLELYFQANWIPLPSPMSFGHDIELSWLLVEAAEAVKYKLDAAREACLALAKNSLKALDLEKGGLFYEGKRVDDSVILDQTKVWWVQAEGLVGFLNAYQLSGDPRFLSAHQSIYQWITRYQMDHAHGEWFDKIFPDGSKGYEKGSVWKTLYHNSRAMMRCDLTHRPLDGVLRA